MDEPTIKQQFYVDLTKKNTNYVQRFNR